MEVFGEEQVKSREEYLQQLNEDKMCLESFLLRVKDELTVSCSIPITIPDKNLLTVIDTCKKWFYEHYQYSVQEDFLHIKESAFSTESFKKNRGVKLPLDIFSVTFVHKTNYRNNSPFGLLSASSTMPYNTINSYNDYDYDLVSYIMHENFESLRSSILDRKYVSHNFNKLTHIFKLTGEIPKTDLVLSVLRRIPDCALFEDSYFFSYVVGKSMLNISRVLGLFTFNLPGGVQMNYDVIQSEGQTMVDKIEEEIKTNEPVDWFFVT